MIQSGVFRLGRDSELKYLPSGAAILNIAAVYNYGKKQQDGTRASQGVDLAMFGVRAETLAPYLLKGTQANFTVQDPHIETYPKNDGTTGFKLTAIVIDVELLGGKTDNSQQQAAPQQRQQQPAQQRPAAQRPVAQDDFDDGIPF